MHEIPCKEPWNSLHTFQQTILSEWQNFHQGLNKRIWSELEIDNKTQTLIMKNQQCGITLVVKIDKSIKSHLSNSLCMVNFTIGRKGKRKRNTLFRDPDRSNKNLNTVLCNRKNATDTNIRAQIRLQTCPKPLDVCGNLCTNVCVRSIILCW